jgi:uncharacterized membrane protein
MEQQTQHRHNIESAVIQNTVRDQRLGVIFAFILAKMTLIIDWHCIYTNKNILGTVIGGAGITGVITAFIYGTRSNRLERQRKAEQLQQTQNSTAHYN